MTRKDYIIIAEVIAMIPDIDIRKTAAAHIRYHLAADNPRFDARKFYEACGVRA